MRKCGRVQGMADTLATGIFAIAALPEDLASGKPEPAIQASPIPEPAR